MLSPLGYYRPGSVYPRALLRRPPGDTQITGGKDLSVLDGAGALGGSGSGHALIICTDQQPAYSAGEQHLSVYVYNYVDGDVYYLYPCCRDINTTGPVEVKFTCVSAPSFWNVKLGSEDKNFLVLPDAFGGIQLLACIDGEAHQAKAWVNFGPNEPCWDDSLMAGTGRYSGIGHNNPDHVNYFDNYHVGEMRDKNGLKCNDCFCWCHDRAIPKKLHLTVVDAIDRASCAGGYSCDMLWEWGSGADFWRGSYTVIDGSWSQTFEWCLRCSEFADDEPYSPGANFSLSLCSIQNCGDTWVDGWETVFAATEESTCRPLVLRFGPMGVEWSDLTCFLCRTSADASGEFYIEITL